MKLMLLENMKLFICETQKWRDLLHFGLMEKCFFLLNPEKHAIIYG